MTSMSASSAVTPGTTRPAGPDFGGPVRDARDAILLVEDDDMVAILLTQVLERLHWRVLRADDAAGGERLAAQHGATIAVALVDCGLPDADGAGLAERLRSTLPGLPLLLTSGRECSGVAQGLKTGGPAGFLGKPFLPGEVLNALRNLLAGAA